MGIMPGSPPSDLTDEELKEKCLKFPDDFRYFCPKCNKYECDMTPNELFRHAYVCSGAMDEIWKNVDIRSIRLNKK